MTHGCVKIEAPMIWTKLRKLLGPRNQRRSGVDIPLTLLLWRSERGSAAGLEPPGSGIPHLFVLCRPKTTTGYNVVCTKLDTLITAIRLRNRHLVN